LEYEIQCILLTKEIEELHMLLETLVSEVSIDFIGEFALAIKIMHNDNKVYFTNLPTIQLDGDEYPKLVISRESHTEHKWIKMLENQRLEKISIIRDEVSWNYQEKSLKVILDVAIKLTFSNEELIVFVVDSIGGLMKCINTKPKTHDNIMQLPKYWAMKTDCLSSATRNELLLSGSSMGLL